MGEFIDKAKGTADEVIGNAKGLAQEAKGHAEKIIGSAKGVLGDKL